MRFSTNLVFYLSGTLWFLLGFWCSWVALWPLLYKVWHGKFILLFQSFTSTFLYICICACIHVNDHFAEYFSICQWSPGMLWLYVWWRLWWWLPHFSMAILCPEWCCHRWGSIYFIVNQNGLITRYISQNGLNASYIS